MQRERLRVLCVDDDPAVTEALRSVMARSEGVDCVGSLASTHGLEDAVEHWHADVVVIGLAGPEPFAAIQDLRSRRPDVRVIVYAWHVREDLVDRALDAGAWGYIAKDGPPETVVWAVREVAAGRMAISAVAVP